MSDDLRVDLARLSGRLDGIVDRLDRQETACERRAEGHVDQALYLSERNQLREDVVEVRALLAAQERDHAKAVARLNEKLAAERKEREDEAKEHAREQRRTRQWAWGIAVTVGATVATVLVAVLT